MNAHNLMSNSAGCKSSSGYILRHEFTRLHSAHVPHPEVHENKMQQKVTMRRRRGGEQGRQRDKGKERDAVGKQVVVNLNLNDLTGGQ